MDDHPLYREGVATALAAEDDFVVVGEGDCAADALRLIREVRPDVLLLDLNLPGGGLSVVQALRRDPTVRVVLVTVSADEHDLAGVMQAGARGYVLKGVSAAELRAVVRCVQQGEIFVTPALATALLLSKLLPEDLAESGHRAPELNVRERQVLSGLSVGHSNKEIARALAVTETTVKHHVTLLFQKMGVRNRVQAALVASDWMGRTGRRDDPPADPPGDSGVS